MPWSAISTDLNPLEHIWDMLGRGIKLLEPPVQTVLQPVVVPHFGNHPFGTRPVYMDDNDRPHRSRAVTAYLQNEAITNLPWPAMSPDLNPLQHIWDMLGRGIQLIEPPVQTLQELEAALHREWRQLPIGKIRGLAGGMRGRLEYVIRTHGGYTHY